MWKYRIPLVSTNANPSAKELSVQANIGPKVTALSEESVHSINNWNWNSCVEFMASVLLWFWDSETQGLNLITVNTQHYIPTKSIKESQKQKQKKCIVQYIWKKTSSPLSPQILKYWRGEGTFIWNHRMIIVQGEMIPDPHKHVSWAMGGGAWCCLHHKILWPVPRVSTQPEQPDSRLTAECRLWQAFPGFCESCFICLTETLRTITHCFC